MHSKTRLFAMLCASVVALGALAEAADARPRPAGRTKARRFEANKGFGLGLMLGAPSGLSGKYYYAADKAFDFGLGAIGYYRGRDGLHIHFDHLWHPLSFASTPAFELPLYIGVGARLFNFDDDRVEDEFDGTAVGVRVPVGVAFDFNNQPLDIFIEFVPVLDFINYRNDDDVDFDINVAVGIRYFFN